MSFQVIYDLYPLSNEERQKYLDDLSREIGLPVELKGLDLIAINQEYQTGKRLVAYARRGITDLLRGIHNISITGMTSFINDKVAMFVANGKNATGRTESAVGAHSIEGLQGEKLASAIMTAETRAGRRVTLKFVGHGILDYTEVEEIVDLSKAGVPINELLDPIPAPQLATPAQFNDAPGKDITAADLDVQKKKSAEDHANYMKAEYARAQEALKARVSDVPQSAPAGEADTVDNGKIDNPPPAEKPKRKRVSRKTVEIASPGQEQVSPVQTEMPMGTIDTQGVITPAPETRPLPPAAPPVVPPPVNEKLPLPEPVVPPQAIPVVPVQANPAPGVVDQEKIKAFGLRFRKYSLELLPAAGLKPSEKMGINAKLALLANRVNDATEIRTQNEAQWEEFLGYLDGYVAEHGIEALVKHINEVAGAA